jgi:hypothetical protein
MVKMGSRADAAIRANQPLLNPKVETSVTFDDLY